MEWIQWTKKYWSKILFFKLLYVKLNKYKVKSGTSLRFLGKKGWINEIDLYGWFQ